METFNISTGKDLHNFEETSVDFDDLLIEICTEKWTPATFKNAHRTRDNFLYADVLGIDVDDMLTIEEAMDRLEGYQYIIAPTKNHLKEKHGVIAERFRIILFLESRITNEKDYRATWIAASDSLFPEADRATKDGSRYYEPSTHIQVCAREGKKFPVTKWTKPEVNLTVVNDGPQGVLANRTYKFLSELAPAGSRHQELIAAATDAWNQGMPQEKFISLVQKTIEVTGNWAQDYLSEKDLETIQYAYDKDPDEAVHDVRIVEEKGVFDLMTLDDLENLPEIEYMVEGLLPTGGLSIISGDPKAGKSTLVRQLTKAVLQGDKFLGREVQTGDVLYLALEEQGQTLREEFKHVKTDKKIIFHIGDLRVPNPTGSLRDIILEYGFRFIVIDTLHLFTQIDNINDYTECNKKLSAVRNVARDTGAHIIMVHHSNKGDAKRGRSMLGSQALTGSADCIIQLGIMDDGSDRYIQSQQRGGTPFGDILSFTKGTKTYNIKQVKKSRNTWSK